MFFPLSFKPTTINHQPPFPQPSTINPSALVNSSTCCAASAKERKSTADWCPEVHSSAAAERTLATLPGQNGGRMSYMTCFEIRFQGQQKRYTRLVWMNNIQYLFEPKNSGTSGVYQVRIHQNPVSLPSPQRFYPIIHFLYKCATVNQNRSVQDKGAKQIPFGWISSPSFLRFFHPQNTSGSCCRSLVRTSRSSKHARKLMGTCQFLRFLISTVLESQQSMKIKGRFHGAPKWWELATVSHWWFNLNMNMHDHSYYLVMKSMWKYICAWHSLEVLS